MTLAWKACRRGVLLAAVLSLAACTTVLTRNPVPEEKIATAAPYGIDGVFIRAWGDTISEEGIDQVLASRAERLRKIYAEELAAGGPIVETSLALSGGGPDGAFGAGILNAWTERGDRPEFTIVTGISTGAIVALFAFLGPDYDAALKEVYTTYDTDDFLIPTLFSALTGGSAASDTRRYRRLIESYVNDDLVARLGEEFRRGRVLLIGTTNLDAARPVIWNVAAIAASGHPEAKTLIQDIIQASSAVPAAFPPVLIPVETEDGKRHDEMHVDGGATQQVMLFSPQFPIRRIDEELGVHFDRTLYVIMNNKLKRGYDPVRPRIVSIAGRAVSTLIGGSGTGDIYKIYAIAERDGIQLEVVSIPADFDLEPQELFDPTYMQSLYDLGYEMGLAGDFWHPRPPDFQPWPETD